MRPNTHGDNVSLLDLRLNYRTTTVALERESWTYLDTGGDGPPLVILPGAFAGCEAFYAQVLEFAGAHRTLVVGYPGCDVAGIVRGFRSLMDLLEVRGPVTLAGWAFGAYLAQAVASSLQAPALRALVLVNGYTRTQLSIAPDLESIRRQLPEALKERYRQMLLDEAGSDIGQLEEAAFRLVSATVAKARVLSALSAPPLHRIPGSLVCPVHLVACERDPLYRGDNVRDLLDLHPHAACHRIRAGYFSFATAPQEINRVLAIALSS